MCWPLKMGPIRRPETSVRNHPSKLPTYHTRAYLIHISAAPRSHPYCIPKIIELQYSVIFTDYLECDTHSIPLFLRTCRAIDLFERVIAVRLTSFVNRQHLLRHAQFGFRKKHSTLSQLARITDYISNGYNLHKHSDMVLLDLEKAYDTVWIHGLLYKLIVFKLPTYLLFTLKAFLEGRSFTVHLNETSSSP